MDLKTLSLSLPGHQGGASVAFPIMTLAFGIVPLVARDFSFMIQSAGMTAAAATIVIMQVQVEMHSVIWSTVGGICGIILGLEEVRCCARPWMSFHRILHVTVRNAGSPQDSRLL